MGIKNLTKFLADKYPEVFDRGVKLDEYAFKKIAIDTAIFMCKFKASNADSWLDSFASLVVWMRRSNAHPVFVLDDGMPPEKAAEKLKRAKARQKQQDRINALDQAVQLHGLNNGLEGLDEDVVKLLQETFEKESKRNGPTSVGRKKALLLTPTRASEFDIHIVKEKLDRMKKHNFSITKEDYETLKKLLDVLKVPWIMAPGEAEKECARMVRHSEAAAVLSEDSDCLAYKASTFLCKPDFYGKTVQRITFSKLLSDLNMKENEFVDFCIMCGTDYNPNIPRIGACKAFDLVQKWKSIDNLPEKLNIDVLNHNSSRRLFCIQERSGEQKSLFTGTPIKNEVEEFFFKHNMRTDINTLMTAMSSNDIIFE